MSEELTWVGILFCITQSATFSGLNLAMFGVSRLNLEIESKSGNKSAQKVLKLRRDANFLLTTILWGNVGINVLLTLLSDSVLAGVSAFVFSTFVITFAGEILPQAYFSRNAIRMGALLSPVIRFYQFALYPVAKPAALFLDLWLGEELVYYYKENQLRDIIRNHIDASESDIDRLEGIGAINFLSLDDLIVSEAGEIIDQRSVLASDFEGARPTLFDIPSQSRGTMFRTLHASGKKWIIITERKHGKPVYALNVNDFLIDSLMADGPLEVLYYCHIPLIVFDGNTLLGDVISKFNVNPRHEEDHTIKNDIILYWGRGERRIISGSDILGRLLRGIINVESRSVGDEIKTNCKLFPEIKGLGNNTTDSLKNLGYQLKKKVDIGLVSEKELAESVGCVCPSLADKENPGERTIFCPVDCPLNLGFG